MKVFNISGPIDEALVLRFMEYTSQLEIQSERYLKIVINSQGGDEHCGRAIAGMIFHLIHKGVSVITVGFGDIHSAATVIFAAGIERYLSKFSSVMVHQSSSEVEGSADDIKAIAKQMDKEEQFWCSIMERLTGTDAKTWIKLHEAETYLTPEECLQLNLATELI